MYGRRILVVDDDPIMQELLIINLRRLGAEILVASDGAQALEELHKSHFDLILLDVIMPEIDGWELLKLIRDDPEFENMKVILLTARDSDKDRMIGKDIFKADEFIAKPFDLNNLINVIRGLLNGTGT